MKKIIFKAIAGDIFVGENNRFPTEEELSSLDGVSCQDNFAEYSSLESKLESGYMSFVFEKEALYTVTEYDLKEDLTPEEVESLLNETVGQWSDGIGEGFEQSPCSFIGEEEVFISPWHPEQIVETIIE